MGTWPFLENSWLWRTFVVKHQPGTRRSSYRLLSCSAGGLLPFLFSFQRRRRENAVKIKLPPPHITAESMSSRSLSRGRLYDRPSPGGSSRFEHSIEQRPSDPYGKKQSYASQRESVGRMGLYATPPRSPLDSRKTYSESYNDDHRNPVSEGRHFRSTSAIQRESPSRTVYDDDDDFMMDEHGSIGDASAHSARRARDVLSKMRSAVKVPNMRSSSLGRSFSASSPGSRRHNTNRELLNQEDSLFRAAPPPEISAYDAHGGDPRNRYETLGMMEDLKMKEKEINLLRRELNDIELKHEKEVALFHREMSEIALKHEELREKETSALHHDMNEMHRKHEELREKETTHLRREISELQSRYDEMSERLHREIDGMQKHHEADVSGIRSKLVSTFKEDMHEMKTEWEEAFRKLKEDSDATQRAMSAELNDAARAKANVEAQLAEYRAVKDDEQRREMDDLKKSKEEDLERLRRMYEEHLNGLKGEINILLEDNEKVKMHYDKLENENRRHYDKLENENRRYKSDLSEISSDYDKALKESVRWEKEATNLKSELNNACDENDNYARHCEALEDKHNQVSSDLDRMTAQYDRAQTNNTRLEKELQAYDDLVKKLDEIQEERTLESRYTEALVKQRDNMNAIIESTQQETEEMKSMIQELSSKNKQYAEMEKEFNLRDASAVREALTKVDTVRERLEVLTRERERYNATVKALKIDLTMLHGADAGNETSLQEHMRLLNERWEANETKLRQADKVKSELNESIQLLEENSKERENMKKEHNVKVSKLERDLKEAQASLIGMERDHAKESSKQSEKVTRLEQDLAEAQTVLVKMERDLLNLKKVETESRDLESLKADAIIEATKKKKLEDELEKLEETNKGLKGNLETAYFNLEETQRTLSSLQQDHEDEMQKFETELSKISNQKGIIESQETEIRRLKDKLSRSKRSQSQDLEDAQNEVAESYKLQVRMLEEKYDNQERRNSQRIVELERILKEQKESLEQKSMAEVKRRGEFAKQRQELEILRSKERHLETHINQLEEHISKVVADYENKLQSSGRTVCSNDYSNSEEIKAMRKQVRELEKKLEVSSAAMKQLGKSSLLMEKENTRLKSDKNELKSKLKKLVDCAEKFGPK